MKVNSQNYCDIAEALHAVLMHYHEGHSETYALLCRSRFQAGLVWSESRVSDENPYFIEVESLAKENNTEQLTRLMDEVDQVLEALD